MRGLALREAFPPALVLAGVAASVEVAKSAGWLPVTIPAPSAVVAEVPEHAADLVWHLGGTLRSALLGYAVAAVVAVAAAAVAQGVPRAERSILGFGVLVDCFPLIALAPIFVIWLGQGPTLYVVIAAIAAFFPLLVGAVQGLKATDAGARELFHVMAASRWQRLRLLAVPAALPFVFQALKIAAPLALLGALIGEWIGAERGIGAMMLYALFSFDVPVVWLTILTICGSSALAYGLIALIERSLVDWGPDGGADG